MTLDTDMATLRDQIRQLTDLYEDFSRAEEAYEIETKKLKKTFYEAKKRLYEHVKMGEWSYQLTRERVHDIVKVRLRELKAEAWDLEREKS